MKLISNQNQTKSNRSNTEVNQVNFKKYVQIKMEILKRNHEMH